MSVVERRRFARILALGLGGVALIMVCTVAARTLRTDPMVVVEILSAAITLTWASLLGRHLWRGRQLARALAPLTIPARVHGIECRVVADPETRAFVLGTIRPTIYLGDDLLTGLDPDELRAVLLHEEYHRRTRGPLRAASLEAWLRLARPVSRLSGAVADRLVDLEKAADRFAIRQGATTAAIASALVKLDGVDSAPLAAFASAADRRVGGLLEFTAGRTETLDQLPYEWLPPVVAVITLVLCHITGVVGAT